MRYVHGVFSIACVTLVAIGCKRDRGERERPPTTTTTSADLRAFTEAGIKRIAEARCAAEVSCDETRPARRHTSLEICKDLLASELKGELDEHRCPNGLEERRVTDCVSAIERTSCFDPIDMIERIEACRPRALCIK